MTDEQFEKQFGVLEDIKALLGIIAMGVTKSCLPSHSKGCSFYLYRTGLGPDDIKSCDCDFQQTKQKIYDAIYETAISHE